MQEIIKDITKFRSYFNSSFVDIPVATIPFVAMISGILIQKGLSFETAISLSQTIEHLFSAKKVITKEQYSLLLNALYSNPKQSQKIEDKVLIPKAARQSINVEAELKQIGGDEMTNTIPLDQDTQELLGSAEEEDQTVKRRKEEQERKSLQFIMKLQKQQERMMNKSQAEGDECQVCLVGLYQQSTNPFPLQKCGHVFHLQCLQPSLNASIAQRKFPLKCPNDSCNQEITERDIRQILSVQNLQKYQQFTLKNYFDMNSDTVSWCPTAGCKYVFFYSSEDPVRFECTECLKQYCLSCRVAWHRDMSCKEFQVSNSFSEEDQKFIKFATGAHYKQCPKCKFWVQKTMGCDHMRCRCTYEFCYKCGGKYMECECTKQMQRRNQQRRIRLAETRRKRNQKKRALAAAAASAARGEQSSGQQQQPKGMKTRRGKVRKSYK